MWCFFGTIWIWCLNISSRDIWRGVGLGRVSFRYIGWLFEVVFGNVGDGLCFRLSVLERGGGLYEVLVQLLG